ncbi:MAG: rRNA maturation RNase YbeY [Candidatus Thiodiazotropha sp. L084R]
MSRLLLEIQRVAKTSQGLPSDQQLHLWAEAALETGTDEVEMVIRLVDEPESQQLNRDYRGKDKPTNVLSFPFEAPEMVSTPLIGDLVVCVPLVALEADQQSKTLEAHWAHMVVHGVLHLQGYDHQNDHEAQIMEDRERDILLSLQFSDPYINEKQ